MLKIINGNPRTMFSCFFYLSDCSDVSIVDLEQVVADWDFLRVLNVVVSSKGLRQIQISKWHCESSNTGFVLSRARQESQNGGMCMLIIEVL